MKVVFVVPNDDSYINPLHPICGSRILPPISLARMAGMAGNHGRVALVDERVVSFEHETQADIAVIFINSYNQVRAYLLGKMYQQLGSYVVFTGPMSNHSSNEACKYSDCLFIGEGPDCLAAFLSDFKNGKTQRHYGSTLENAGDNARDKASVINYPASYGNTVLSLA